MIKNEPKCLDSEKTDTQNDAKHRRETEHSRDGLDPAAGAGSRGLVTNRTGGAGRGRCEGRRARGCGGLIGSRSGLGAGSRQVQEPGVRSFVIDKGKPSGPSLGIGNGHQSAHIIPEVIRSSNSHIDGCLNTALGQVFAASNVM